MSYASIGIIAFIVQVIINFEVLRTSSRRTGVPVHAAYQKYLIGTSVFYLIDASWGVFYNLRIPLISYIVTMAFFVIMALSVFLWIRYVIVYLNVKSRFQSALSCVGWFFLIFQILVLIVNIFVPIGFRFDEEGEYHVYYARYLNLGIQTLLFFVTAVYMLVITAKSEGNLKHRHRTIGFSSLVMMIFVVGQAHHPLLPLYSVGCMLTTCLIHVFVLEDEKEEHHQQIERFRELELKQAQALGSARHMAYTDPLTGVKNKHAYLEAEKLVDQHIKEGSIKEFGIIVFDLNGLKQVNDTKGHDAGDRYIQSACRLICAQFKHSPVYRIGGDEFVAFLEGEDFIHQEILLRDFERRVEENQKEGRVVVSSGFDSFNSDLHDTFITVFERADKKMYERKRKLKENQC